MFGMGRKDGGPSWYEDNLPEILRDKTGRIIAIVCGLLIIFGGLFVLLGFLSKKKKIMAALKFLICTSSGALLLPTVMSHSWCEVHKNILAQMGPHDVPTRLKIGIKSGIWEVDIYIEAPGVIQPEFFQKEELNLANREIMYRQHVFALKKGWTWPLLLLTSFLGGEKPAWEGLLGECLNKASLTIRPCIYAVGCLWIFWCISYKVSDKCVPIMMMAFGVSTAVTAGIYCLVIFSSCPRVILTSGDTMTMTVGWSVQLVGGFGVCCFILGLWIHCTCKPVTMKRVYLMVIKDSTVKPAFELRILQDVGETFFTDTDTSRRICPNSDEYTQKSISPTVMSQMFAL